MGYYNKETIEEVAGFKILKGHGNEKYEAIRGKSVFGNLNEMDYVGVGQMSGAVDELPLAETTKIMSQDGAGTYGRFRFLRNAESKEPFAPVSKNYKVIQHSELLHPLLDACQEHGIHIAGVMETLDGGARVKGRVIVGNPEWTFSALTEEEDPIMMGFRFSSAHDGKSSVRIEPFSTRVVCLNDNLWGSYLPSLNISHKGDVESKVKEIGAFFYDYMEEVPSIRELIERSTATEVTRDELLHAALGAGIPIRHLTNWQQNLNYYEPMIETHGLNLWTGYNSLTAYLTHDKKMRTKSSDNQERLLTLGEKLLDSSNLNALIEKGQERAEKLRKKRIEQQADGFDGRKTVPEIKGVTVVN